MLRGVFLDKASIDPQGIDFSMLDDALSDWQYFDRTATTEIAHRIQNAELVVTNKVPLSREHLLQAKKLKCICVAATGFDHINVRTAQELGIVVCNVDNYSTPGVVQHTFGLMIGLLSQIANYHQLVLQGAWASAKTFCVGDFQTYELYGKTLGIIGYGRIGKSVEKVAQAFGMKVIVAEHKTALNVRPGRVAFQDMLAQADIISLHCPLSAQTRNLIGAHEIKQMKSSAFLINVSRGGLIDEEALYEALKNGQLRGAALDVLAQEPPSPDNPLLSPQCPNILLSPHIAWNTVESRQRLVNELAHNVAAFLEGQVRNRVR